MRRFYRTLPALTLAVLGSRLAPQAIPQVRPLGRVLATSIESFESVSQVRALPAGRILVNDNTGRRLVLLDSSLRQATVIADSTGASGIWYSSRIGGLIAYRGDSSLFVDPSSLSLLVLDGNARFVRTLAPPPGNHVHGLIGGPFGTPGLDAEGRLIYRAPVASRASRSGSQQQPSSDSAWIVRFNFVTRTVETVVKWRIPAVHQVVTNVPANGRVVQMVISVVDPIPWTDDWAVLADGTIAVVRGHDYRVDLVDGRGRITSAPRIPFDWRRLTDDDKSALLDSLRAARESTRAAFALLDPRARVGSGRNGASLRPYPLQFVPISEMPDYVPPFRQGAARGDADGNLWVRTSDIVSGGAVYDVIDARGVLVDRVRVPPGSVIAGFGPHGTVYLAVRESGIARVERARTR